MTDRAAEGNLPRTAHRAVEPIHTMVYFTPEPNERYAALGITGGMRPYVSSRSAPLGRAPAEVVTATFYNFSPRQIEKAIPSVWESASPDAVLEARAAGADAALRRLLGDIVDSDDMVEAATLAREASTACTVPGRPLFAAHVALPWPQPAHLQLWHAATLLREHRGDGHIAALVLAGLSGIEAAVSYVATGRSMPEELLRKTRGYSEEEWAAAKAALRERGVVDADGALTEAGRRLRDEIEERTDVSAGAPYDHLGPQCTQRLVELVQPWARSINKQLFG